MQHVCFLEQEQNNHLKQRKPGYYLELTNCMMKYHLFLYCKLLSPDNRHCKLLSPDIFFLELKLSLKLKTKILLFITINHKREINPIDGILFLNEKNEQNTFEIVDFY